MFQYHTKTLKNKLRVCFVPMESASIAVNLVVGVGSKDEESEIRGISHFLEHLSAFTETQKRPQRSAVAQELDRIGAFYNAGTSKESISYQIKTIPEHLEFILDLLRDTVFNFTLDKTKINKERGIILEEYNMYEDTPMQKIDEVFEKKLFGGSTLAWEKIGTKQIIRTLTIKDFRNFHQRYFRPGNMVLVIVGGRKLKKEVFDLVTQFFGDLKDQPVERKQIILNSWPKQKILIEKKKTRQTHLLFGVPTFKRADPRIWPMRILNTLTGGNITSRLHMLIREKYGWAYYCYSFSRYYREAGYWAEWMGVRNAKVKQVLEKIKQETTKLYKEITIDEVKDSKTYLKGKILLSLEDPLTIADLVASSWLFEGKIRTVAETLEKIKSVKIDQVKELAEQIFKKDNFYLAGIGPKIFCPGSSVG